MSDDEDGLQKSGLGKYNFLASEMEVHFFHPQTYLLHLQQAASNMIEIRISSFLVQKKVR